VQENAADESMLDRIQQSPGLVLDISAVSLTGAKWDVTKEGNRQDANELVSSKVALIVIASPIMHFKELMVKTHSDYDKAIRRVEQCTELCRTQDEQGMIFMFEYPYRARSWNDNSKLKDIREMKNVHFAHSGSIEWTEGNKEEMIVVTNSKDIADNIDKLGRSWKSRQITIISDKSDMIDDEMRQLAIAAMLQHMKKTGRINE
jgi:hypothetical protein